MNHSLDHICNMITDHYNNKYSFDFYIAATDLLIKFLNRFQQKTFIKSRHLTILKKTMFIPKKLNDASFLKEFKIKKNLHKILKLNVIILRNINQLALGENIKQKKEYQEFVRNTIVSDSIN